jgi:hypothetical protein
VDAGRGDPWDVQGLEIALHGAEAREDDLFVLIEAFGEVADGAFGHAADFAGEAGRDHLNAAALRSGTMVDLMSGAASPTGSASSSAGSRTS